MSKTIIAVCRSVASCRFLRVDFGSEGMIHGVWGTVITGRSVGLLCSYGVWNQAPWRTLRPCWSVERIGQILRFSRPLLSAYQLNWAKSEFARLINQRVVKVDRVVSAWRFGDPHVVVAVLVMSKLDNDKTAWPIVYFGSWTLCC